MAGEISTFALSPAIFPLCLLFFAMEAGISILNLFQIYLPVPAFHASGSAGRLFFQYMLL